MESVVSSLLRFAQSQPDALAVIDHGRPVSYGELAQASQAHAAWLHGKQIRAGDIAALSFDLAPENSLRLLQTFYALAYLGATILPLTPETPLSRRTDLVERFRARWLISLGEENPTPGAVRIDPAEFDPHGGDAVFRTAPRGDDPDRPFLHLFTSGTTGSPKVCLFSVRQVAESRISAAAAIDSASSDRQLASVPWPATAGLRTLLRIHAVGGTFVNARVPESRRELAEMINEYGITQLVVSPWQIRRILKSDAPPDLKMPKLRVLHLTGAFIAPHEIRAIREAITPNTYNAYGSNELGVMALLRPEDPAVSPGGVGRAVSGVEAQVVGDNDEPVAAGSDGYLRFRAPWMPSGYIDNEKATRQRFRDGWFYPGDIGSIDAMGHITLRGRSDDVINVGAIKISPADVESVLLEHPDIADAALAGIPDPMIGQLAVAFIVPRREIDAEKLREFCAERIDYNRIPAYFMGVAEIPRNPDGKIQRDRLRETFLSKTRPSA
jgi:long-chain acyl-CoA synthetase